jgi:uncharacterized membrane protein YdjX (TVP38/TMEM64 family)
LFPMKKYTSSIALLFFVGLGIGMFFWQAPIELFKETLSGLNAVSYIVYVLILTAAVVFMPLTVMPIIPVAAAVLGPFTTALLSIIGWSLGGAIAFLISRHLGRPFLEKFLNLQKLDDILERIPEKTHFWFIVLLRLTLPVDLVSYALGLTKSLSFTSYIAATVVGVCWFSFAFAYMGNAFFEGSVITLVGIVLASIGVFALGWYLLHNTKQ